MRHQNRVNKLNRYASHRNALLKNLARSVFENGDIITSTAKAKAVRPLVEKLITKAKEANATDNADRRVALNRDINRYFNDRKLVQKIVHEIAPRFADRNGGYTRILKIGFQRGDATEMSLLQILPESETKK